MTGDAGRPPVSLVLVAAVADDGVIGRSGTLPWRLGSDLRRFRSMTSGHPVVMGRKTYRAIGKPLRQRTNIVVTRDPAWTAAGVVAAPSLDAALAAARGDALRRSVDAVMVIGGADIYAQLIGCAARLEITRVHMRAQGDVAFPTIDAAQWRETARRDYPAGADDDAPFTCLTYDRVSAPT